MWCVWQIVCLDSVGDGGACASVGDGGACASVGDGGACAYV